MSFELKADAAEADAFLRRLRLVVHTVSLGGVETLATRPAATSHAALSAEERSRPRASPTASSACRSASSRPRT